MAEAVIAGKHPEHVVVKPGTYQWCACGRSEKQPFCGGSHVGTGIEPHPVEFTESLYVGFCMCKRTARPPYCDGAHARLG